MWRFFENHANQVLAWGYIIGGLWGLILTIYIMLNANAGAVLVAILAFFCVLYGFGILCGNSLRLGRNRALWGILALALIQVPIASSGPELALPQFQYMFGFLVLAPLEFGINGGAGISFDLGSQWSVGFAGPAPQYVGINLVALAWIQLVLICLRRARQQRPRVTANRVG